MILLELDRTEKTPLFSQIARRLRGLMEEGTLNPGDRLPASRELAVALGVNRTTVTRAYEELWSGGYLESVSGSYTRVRRRHPVREQAAPEENGSPWDWESRLTASARGIRDAVTAGQSGTLPGSGKPDSGAWTDGVTDFRTLSPDPRFYPLREYRRALSWALDESRRELLCYGDSGGYKPLRESLARYMALHGVKTGPEEILITGGAQGALDLVLRALVEPGSTLICENPTYSSGLALFRGTGARVLGIPMTPEGMDLEALERELETCRPALVYAMPSFQNPTGISTSQAHREKLLALCADREIPLVEDGFVEEMKYTGKAVLPVKAMDRQGRVIYLGTLSKALFPGIRIGWLVAPAPLTETLAAIQSAASLAGSPLQQAALDRFLREGCLEGTVRRIHTAYRKRMAAAMKAVRGWPELPGVSVTRPSGGYTFWVRFPGTDADERAVEQALAVRGILVRRGGEFFTAPPRGAYLRISIARTEEEEIGKGLEILGEILRNRGGQEQ